MKKKILIRAAAAAGILAAAVLAVRILGGSRSERQMDTSAVVKTQTVENGSLSSDTTYVGTISAEGTARVVARVSGMVTGIHVSVGDMVEAGQLLCDLDDESARLSLETAKQNYEAVLAGYGGSSLSLVQGQLQLAQSNYERQRILYDGGGISRVEFEEAGQSLRSAQATWESAQANVRTAQGNVESAEYQYSLYHMTAPVAGVVEAVNVTGNNFFSSGSTAFVISNAENKTVTFYVTDDVRNALPHGQAVTVGSQGEEYEGTISEISGVVDVNVGLFQIKALLKNAGNLPDGLAVDVTTATHRAEHLPVIPNDALYFENGVSYVYVAEEGTAVRRDVELALYTEEEAALASGIEAGDELIISWSTALKDGAQIRIAQETEE